MKKQDYLNTMGIDIWQRRENNASASEQVTTTVVEETIYQQPTDATAWQALQDKVASCTLCALSKSRSNTVFGAGNSQANLMIIGEAPGADEDAQGKPFVGRAGKLLTEMLKGIGLSRETVFIANILKCRPPNNRDPDPTEVKTCTPYLQQQINFIQPKLIVALGKIAAQHLLDTNASLGSMRERVHQYGEQQTPLLITYHPAYLLRSPGQKAKSYEDLRRVKKLIA
jgi:uracil-DNA glycosylase